MGKRPAGAHSRAILKLHTVKRSPACASAVGRALRRVASEQS